MIRAIVLKLEECSALLTKNNYPYNHGRNKTSGQQLSEQTDRPHKILFK